MPRKYIKNTEKSIQLYRSITQILFILICIWIGIEFYLFTKFIESPGSAVFVERPPGAEAFLPISALMSVYYFIQTGIIHDAHPAGFFILIAVIAVSLVFGKSFCSWICPIGTLSEYIADFGDKIQKKLFKKVYRLPRWLDYPLRSLKYLLLGFFVYSIFFTMSTIALRMFLDSPYNLVADVKMWYFFADISKTSLIVISVLFFLSIFIRNFWCRFLCPYGALLGIFSLLSPQKITRDPISCIDCALCAKACPSNIKVDKVKTVFSDECSTCMSCVD
ncbi:MAG: 4Fe-4S binding protein, partial [Melioribacteraceae bacterium]|nr:4Fe-4S binding protein [Melioribacteraceae bacterium]